MHTRGWSNNLFMIDTNNVPDGTQEDDAAPKTQMDELMNTAAAAPQLGDSVEGKVINIDRGRIYIDLSPYGTAIIYGREYLSARDILKNVNVGDSIAAKVVDIDNKDGYVEVSLREARQALIWGEAADALSKKTVLELPVKEANKGGLIIEWQGIPGFLPASQLSSEHYPRVDGGDKDQIFVELKKLIGEKVSVIVIAAEPKEQKLIFSEKGLGSAEKAELVLSYDIGDVLDGEITGATDFGVFVKIGENLEGLVHISEMDWALVEDPKSKFKVGEKVKVKVIEVKDSKVSLSIKALTEDPWKEAAKKFKKDDSVEAVIIKYNKHGALASIEEGVAGLVHVSDFGTPEKLREELTLGRAYSFTISVFEPDSHKMTLSFKKEE